MFDINYILEFGIFNSTDSLVGQYTEMLHLTVGLNIAHQALINTIIKHDDVVFDDESTSSIYLNNNDILSLVSLSLVRLSVCARASTISFSSIHKIYI